MAIGDDAAAAGFPLVSGSLPANQIDTELNRTRDLVAQNRVRNAADVVTTGSNVQNDLNYLNSTKISNDGAGTPTIGYIGGNHVRILIPGYMDQPLANVSDVDARVAKTGDEMSGYLRVNDHIYVPNAFPAVSGYTILYQNSDGRISKGASSERYKKYISAIEPSELGDIFPQLHRFQMRSLDGTGDGHWRYGYIAERLDEDVAQRTFVVYDEEGRPDSIDFIGLLLAQVANLNARLKALEEGP
jgi:hypothetical protein